MKTPTFSMTGSGAARVASLALLAASVLVPPSSFAQGSLTPPGAPAPTMKTLDQLEARTPISSLPFTIGSAGSYYLTGNLSVSSGNGITIGTDQVTLDLNGFAITSTASPASGTAIFLTGTRRNVVIKNGFIRGTTTFAAGAFTPSGFLDGIQNTSGSTANIRIVGVGIHGMASDGINFATTAIPTAVVEGCTISICADFGIVAGVVRDCSVDTTGSTAISAEIVTNCYGQTVNASSATALGIVAISNVENCRGISVSGIGISTFNASNSRGLSTSNAGLVATNANNCEGFSTSGSAGISALTGTVSFSRGRRDGGIAINTFNAIGCTVIGTGTVNANNKSLGTP